MRDAGDELLQTMNIVNFVSKNVRSRPWASATFSGCRHELTLRLEGPTAAAEADAFLHGLEERDLPMRDHILADIALVAETRRPGERGLDILLQLEALTIEAA